MKKVLVLGAGLVSRPLVRYLLDQDGFQVTVASRTVSKAVALVDGHPDGTAIPLLADDQKKLDELISEHDLAISLLPAPLHPVIAELCVKHRKHMVTTSYVSPEMKALDGPAKEAGVMVLNEIGVDPGIDHMSAMRIVHDVRKRGGKITSFQSYCGGLPAPDCNDNPFGYKFSWSPRAVLTAGKNTARYRENGKEVDVPGPDLFTHNHKMTVEGVGDLEGYPNRDSLGYIDVYGFKDIETMFRGTFRYRGWCDTLKKIVDLGILDETPKTYPAGTTFKQLVAGLAKVDPSGDVRKGVAAFLKLDPSSDILDRLEWLGLFSDKTLPVTEKETTSLDQLSGLMLEKMSYQPGEKDMIVLCHFFVAKFPDGSVEDLTSTLIDYGIPNGDSSMARTVSLPAAVGARMILTGEINKTGVHVPVTPEIYNPVLDELATMGITCVEKATKR